MDHQDDQDSPPNIPPPPNPTPVSYQIEDNSAPQNPTASGSGRRKYKDDERKHASISLPIPPEIPEGEGGGDSSANRFRKGSGDQGRQNDNSHSNSHSRRHHKSSETIQINAHPAREGSLASSRRSYSRGAFFGDIPEHIGSYIQPVLVPRRMSTGSQGSNHDHCPRHDEDMDPGLGGSRSSSTSEIENILGGASKSYMSRVSMSMNKSVNPLTGETLFWGYTKKQWFLLFIFSIADLLAGVVYSLQAPFYPEEAEKKGAKPTEYGLVFGVFELAMFIVAPIYGKYMSKLGPRNVFNGGIFVTGTCCILFGLLDRIDDKWTFISLSFAIRIIEAIGNAGFSTATFTLIAMEFPESVATTFASLETFFGVGLIVGPTLGGGLYQVGGYTLPFVVTGGFIFTTAILIAIFMPKGQPIDQSLGRTEKHPQGYGILTILRIPGVLLATMAIITGALSIGFLSSSLEPHIRQFNLSPFMTGLVFVINGGVYALSAPGWGWLCDRIQQTKYITFVGAICIIVGFLFIGPAPFFPMETVLWVTCVGLFIQGLGMGAAFVSSFILALRHSVAAGLPDNVATYSVVSGLWSSVLALGLFVGPSAAGVLYDTVGFRWGSMFVAGFGVFLALFIIFFLCCNQKGEEAYFRTLAARSNSSNSSGGSNSSNTPTETDPLITTRNPNDDHEDVIRPAREGYGALA